MPVLNVLCTCERVIIDAKGIPSLISLFQRMDLQLTDTPFPEDAVAPARWVVFSMWQLSPEEVGREFIQHTKIIRPNGVVMHEATQPFRVQSDSDLHIRTYMELNGMFIGQEGFYRIQVWLEAEEVHEISFFIKHIPVAQPSEVAQLNLAAAAEQEATA
jgi:hypothetical protein